MQHRTRVAVAEPACNLRQETVKQLVATMISLLSGSARPESQSALNARIACVNIVGIIAAEDAQVAQLLLSDLDSWAALVAALSVPLQPSLAAQRSTSFASVSSPTRQSLPRQISNSFMSGSAFASRSNSVADRETDVRLARSAVRLDVAIWTLDDFVKGALVQLASPSVDAAPLADQPSATAALVTPSTPTVARPSAVLSPLYPQTPPTEKLPATPKSTPITSILTQSSSEPYAVDALVRRILGSPYLLALPAAPATLPFAPQQAQQHLSAPPASSNDRQLYLGCVDTCAASRLVVMHGLPCSLNEADYVSKMSSIRSTGSQLPVHTSAELDLVFSIIKAGLLHTHPDNFDRGVVTLRTILAVFATDNVAPSNSMLHPS
ncbi:hypothetical protein BC831DRAFT_6015 [Entophlyctis helioformis]|nr:hypothetical protein BC831DRAFT_6015 [Entophlyctis helioformis]